MSHYRKVTARNLHLPFQVREVKEELRSMRLEAHTKQLTKELRSARAALENERKLRKVQSDTIKVNIYMMT